MDGEPHTRSEPSPDTFETRLGQACAALRTGQSDLCATLLKQALATLPEGHECLGGYTALWGEVIEAIPDPVLLHDAEFRLVHFNRAYLEVAGQPAEQIRGRPYYEVFPVLPGPPAACVAACQGDKSAAVAAEYRHGDGRIFQHRTYTLRNRSDLFRYGIHVLRDVTDQQLAHQTALRLHAVIEALPDFVAMADGSGRMTYLNPAGRAMVGIGAQEAIEALTIPDFIPPALRPHMMTQLLPALCEQGAASDESQLLHRDGHAIAVAQVRVAHKDLQGNVDLFATISRDITEQKRAEQRLHRLNSTYAVLSECKQALMYADDEQQLLQEFCNRLVLVGGYRLAWVGYAQQDEGRTVLPMAWAGHEEGYLKTATISWADNERGRGPTGTAIRERRPVVMRNADDDARFAPWRAAAQTRNYRSSIALPLASLKGVLNIYSEATDTFDDEEIELLSTLADDLVYAVDRLRTQQAQLANEQLLNLRIRAIESTRNGISITELQGSSNPLIYVNPAFERITGYGRGEALGRDPAFLHRDDVSQSGLDAIRDAVRKREAASVLLRNYRKDGSRFWNELHIAPVNDAQGNTTHYIGIINDVTEHKSYEEQLEYQTNHDELTGLPNRNLLFDRTDQAIAYAHRYNRMAAMLVADIDHLKLVNDSLGHAAGDAALKQIAQQLRSCGRDNDTVARLGGDEFVLLLTDIDSASDAAIVAERVLGIVTAPFAALGAELRFTATIGISLYPKDGNDCDALLRNAGAALHRAKETSRGSFQFFTTAMNTEARRRVTLEAQLRRALERDELRLHYQPQVDLRTGRINGAEALLRWNQPELGPIAPAEFIPVAEDAGLIVPVGQWVMFETCRQIAAWRTRGLPPLTIAVNLSARQFSHHDIEHDVRRTLELHGIEPAQLELELTESAVMNDPDLMLQRLTQLKALGVTLAIDDFGTGYSSLAHLQRFPFDKLKIDRSFVTDVTSDPHNAAIAQTIIAMAHSLKMRAIAEGVETEGQLHFLRRHRCDEIQGFYFGRAVPPDDFERMVLGDKRLPDYDDNGAKPRRRLLIVDDEPEVTRALTRMLHDEDYEVLTANDPLEAFELLAREPVQVVLCDQRMPVMSGTELLSRIKGIYPDTVRIILSGHLDLQAATDAINRDHIYKLLAKPWDQQELLETLRAAFRHYDEQGH